MSRRRRVVESEARYLLHMDPSLLYQVGELAEAVAKELGLVAQRAVERRHTDCYCDDAGMSLQAKGLALRVRSGGDLQPILTLKKDLGREGSLHLRDEFERPLDHAAVRDLAGRLRNDGLELKFDDPGEIQDWQDLVVALQLRPVVVLNQVRQKILLIGGAETDAQFSLDRICYLWPVASLGPTILEIECYSATGRRFLGALERSLSEKWPGLLTPASLSKEEIGLALQTQCEDASSASENQ